MHHHLPVLSDPSPPAPPLPSFFCTQAQAGPVRKPPDPPVVPGASVGLGLGGGVGSGVEGAPIIICGNLLSFPK